MQKQKFNPRKLIKPLIIIAIIGAIGFGGYTVFKYFQESQRMAMMAQFAGRTQIERAEKSDIKELVSASGVIALNNEESIYGANGERVSEVLVEVGDIVEKDQIIVYYDIEDKRDELEKQIQQAEINLRNQELSLKSMVAPVGESELRQLQTGVDSSDKSLYDAQNTVASTEIKIEDQREAISRAQEDVIKAQQDIDKAQSDIDEAEEEKSKQQQLLNVDGISLDEFKQYEKAVETANDAKVKAEDAKVTAELAVTNAQNTLRDLERTLESNQKSVTSAEQNLKNAELNLSEATITLKDEADRINYEKQQNQITLTQLDLEDYRKQLEDITENTTTPLAGTVTSVGVSRGKTVDASTVLVTIADFNDLIVTADISEYDIPKLAIGQPVAMTSDGIADATYTGKVTKIGDSAVSASASSGTSTTVPVEIAFDTVPKDLKPGFNLELEITVNHNPEAVTV
ncbi:MAG: HlyD family efflux transporter periplasmic adaptor subunit, partial [Clostridiales bacterium]|nr:HlyD family efflux transporter periplasmic adaptor subunit [Clostridiales bacterium]